MQQERIRTLRDFQFQALLGRGGFGSVFLATESDTGLVVAIKRIGKSKQIIPQVCFFNWKRKKRKTL